MKSINYLLFCIIILTIFFNACDKYEKLENKYAKMIECHKEDSWHSLKAKDALLGEWKWDYIYCYGRAEDANGDDFKGMSIEFKPNNIVDVKMSGQVMNTSNWEISANNTNPSFFSIGTTPPITQLQGRVVLCGKKLLFHFSYIDQCDNYFKRKN